MAYNNVVIVFALLVVIVVVPIEIHACTLFIFIRVARQAQRIILVFVVILVGRDRLARRGFARRLVILVDLRHRIEVLGLGRALAVVVGHCCGTVG
jgi:cytochrome c biogenesis protein CcdA